MSISLVTMIIRMHTKRLGDTLKPKGRGGKRKSKFWSDMTEGKEQCDLAISQIKFSLFTRTADKNSSLEEKKSHEDYVD